MGVTGAGKTTIGELLARQLHWGFLDADSFHPSGNLEKMRRGSALTDSDREPWLAAIHAELLTCSAAHQNAVLACSALKQSYRDKLACGLDLRVVYLKGTYEQVRERIAARKGHFAGESILAGQFADLEEPQDAIILEVNQTPEQIVRESLRQLNVQLPAAPE